MKKRMEVLFSGTVQGVGFRYTTERLARRFKVSGFVRNLADGRVEVVAEGEEVVLQNFLKVIKDSSMKPYLRDMEVRWLSAEETFRTFGVVF